MRVEPMAHGALPAHIESTAGATYPQPIMPSDADAIIELYDRHAESYARERGLRLGSESGWLARFAALLPAAGHVLDLGCGAGAPIAAHLIASGHAVTGVDSSANMIELCRRRFPQADWHCADMRQLALASRFDGLLAWDSFFHLAHQDQRDMFAIFQRHAAAGAALMFTSGPEHGEAYGEFHGARLYHASLAAQEYSDLLQDHGFAVCAQVFNDPECGGHCVWLAQAV